jgi:hypothetical protein
MTIHTACLIKTTPNTRAGTLTIPVRGEFNVEMWLLSGERAHLRISQNGTVWDAGVTLCREETDDPYHAPWIWNGYVEGLGVAGGWTYRITGRKIDDAVVLEFDDTAKQPYRGPLAQVDANGRVIA